jgi:cation diffusion facilitator family transporter
MEGKPGTKKISSEKVVVTSFIVSLSDVAINFVVAVLSSSVVVLAQALEGAADLLASGFLLIGIGKAGKPRDRKHPYGYGRELYFWTFLSALITFTLTCGLSIYLGIQRFLQPEPVESLPLVYFALILGVLTNGYSMNLSLKRLLGRKPLDSLVHTFKNSALIETKTTLIMDLMGSLASLLGLLALALYKVTGNQRFDGLGSIVIGITLAILVLFIIKGAKDLLVGQSASPEVEEKIIGITKADPNVRKVLDLRTLLIGPERLLINMELNLSDELTTDEIEILIDKIEKEIKKEIPSATNIEIELETPDVLG